MRLSAIGKKIPVAPVVILGEILNSGKEAMITYIAKLLDILLNNTAIPGDWKKIYSGFHLQRVRSIDRWKL
jgi:hypothetical protein